MGDMKRMHSPKGFSLIELLIVIALISIVSAFAVPTWQGYKAKTNLRTAARDVMADISNTKQRAVEENLSVYRLTFSVANNNYVLSRTDTGTVWTKSLASYGSGVRIDSVNGAVLAFQSRGTVSPAGSLVLRNGQNSTAKVTFNINGRTYVQFNIP
jgi:type IV pilus assembly protein PilA